MQLGVSGTLHHGGGSFTHIFLNLNLSFLMNIWLSAPRYSRNWGYLWGVQKRVFPEVESGPCRGKAPLPRQPGRSLRPVSTCLPSGLAEPGQSGPGSSGLQDLGPSASPGPSAAPQSLSQGACPGGASGMLMCQVSFRAPLLSHTHRILEPSGSPGRGGGIDSSLRLPDFRGERSYSGPGAVALLPVNELAGALQRGPRG